MFPTGVGLGPIRDGTVGAGLDGAEGAGRPPIGVMEPVCICRPCIVFGDGGL